MMEEFTQEELRIHEIQQYLMGELSPSKVDEIEARIEDDPDYAREVQKYRFLITGFRTLDAQNLSEKMGEWEAARTQREKTVFIRPWTAIAAAIVLLIGLGFAFQWFSASTQLSAGELYAEAMTDFDPDISSRSNQADTNIQRQSLVDALDVYEEQKYAEAIPLLEHWLENQNTQNAQESANATLCLGIAQMRIGQHSPAIQTLQTIPVNSVYYQHAAWYQALANLGNEDSVAAIKLLENLKSDPFYQSRVQKLLESLN